MPWYGRVNVLLVRPDPGTELHREKLPLLEGQPWYKYDMHHTLWEPRLGARRFFELYAETWRRSILNLGGKKRWTDWIGQVPWTQIPYLTRVLLRTQRLMRTEAYLSEHSL